MTMATDLKWHHYERITDNWMVIPAAMLAGWMMCSVYYKIPSLLSDHGKLEHIVEHRAEWRAEQERAIAAEKRNEARLDALEKWQHQMDLQTPAKSATKLKR